MSRIRTTLIVIVLTTLVCLVVIALRPGEALPPSGAEIPGGPSFNVRVVKPLSARPLFGLFGLLPAGDLRFDHESPGAAIGRVAHDRLELIADGWDLLIETDGEGHVAAKTRLVFRLHLGGRDQTLRCRPAVPAVGSLQTTAPPGQDELGGRFRVELATCENARTGTTIDWPQAPLKVLGSFERLPIAAAAVAAAGCPLDSLEVVNGSVRWGGPAIHASRSDVERSIENELEIVRDPESSALNARTSLAGRPAVLVFREATGVMRLSGITVARAPNDQRECWSRKALIRAVRRAVPGARYLASRHDPERIEAENDAPMYVVADAEPIVVLLKPAQGAIYVGRLDGLD